MAMDFICSLPTGPDSGNDSVFVITERLTKFAIFIPCHTSLTAEGAADLYMQHVFCHFGMPLRIVSDRDKLFTSALWKQLFKRAGTALDMSSGFHPQTDGQTERLNRTLEEMLRGFCGAPERQRYWEQYLPMLQFAYNSTPHTATGHSPFYLNYGRNPRAPVDCLSGVPVESSDYFDSMHAALVDAQCRLFTAQQRMSAYYDAGHRHVEYKVGDLVYVSYKSMPQRKVSKISSLYHPTPFRVVARVGRLSYRLDTPAVWRTHNVFHVSQLRSTPPPRYDEIDYITDIVKVYGRQMAEVIWKDATWEEASFVPLADIKRQHPHLLDNYYDQLHSTELAYQSISPRT